MVRFRVLKNACVGDQHELHDISQKVRRHWGQTLNDRLLLLPLLPLSRT